jgi:hypothetical protein
MNTLNPFSKLINNLGNKLEKEISIIDSIKEENNSSKTSTSQNLPQITSKPTPPTTPS